VARYETLILTIPEITSEESAKLETQFVDAIKKAKGNLISYEKWGKYKLAYSVNKNEYGIYFLARFDVSDEDKVELFEKIKELFSIRFNEIVMRHMNAVLPKQGSLEYQRPKSLEETPQDVDSIVRKSRSDYPQTAKNGSY